MPHHAHMTIAQPVRLENETLEAWTARLTEWLRALKAKGPSKGPTTRELLQEAADKQRREASRKPTATQMPSPRQRKCRGDGNTNAVGTADPLPSKKGTPRPNVRALSTLAHQGKRARAAASSKAMRVTIPAGPAARAIRQLSVELGLDYGETIATVFEEANVK